MKKRLILIASLVFVLCCVLAMSVSAATCDSGHVYSTTVTEGDAGYLGEIHVKKACATCGSVAIDEKIPPLFYSTGYSYSDFNDGFGGISQQFAVDRAAVARFAECTGKTIRFGVAVALEEALDGGTHAIDAFGKPINDSVLAMDMTNASYDIFEVMINNIPEEAKAEVALICTAYITVGGYVSYIENGAMVKSVVANTFNQVVEAVTPEDSEGEDDVTSVESIKILTIGNSFSDDAMEYVYQIAKEAGVQYVELGNLRANSCSLAMHLSYATNNSASYTFRYWADGATKWSDTGSYTMKRAVEYTDWDYIVFQQVSTDSGKASTYDDLNKLIDYVKPLNPEAKLAWHMTWSMRADYASSGPSYSAIVNAVKEKVLTNTRIDTVIATGTAIESAKMSGVMTNVQIQRDARHLAYGMGRYIAGLTFVKALTGLSIDNISYPVIDTEGHTATSGTNENWKSSFRFTDLINSICIQSANAAVESPFTPTEFVFAD